MKRITSKMVINGLKKMNRVPYPGEFITDNDDIDPAVISLPGNGGACGLGAVGFRDFKNTKNDYLNGFIYGFDGDAPLRIAGRSINEKFLTGFCDGVESHLDALIATKYLTRK